MEINDHDCLFVVVNEGSTHRDKLFQMLYPCWYKVRNLPNTVYLRLRRLMQRVIDRAYLQFLMGENN